MSRIGIVTTHNTNNYGAVLQTYALQEVVSRYGDVKIINYDNRHISNSFDLIRFKPSIHGLLGMGKDICRLLPRRRVINKFMEFINEKLKLTRVCSSEELLKGKAGVFDCYVAGSDQIWNPACVSGNGCLDPVYFLDFSPVGAKKVSYASSLGSYTFSDQEKLKLKEYLSDFSVVSVREQGAQSLLQEVLGRKVNHVLDPTLLLSKEEWLKSLNFPAQVLPKEKYILLYTVPKVPLVRSVVEYLSKRIGLRVVTIDQGLSAGAHVDEHIRDAGPLDFIRLFSEAEFVITDSFHGVCFSLNFGKPFVAVSPGKYANRIESLLSLVGLENRLVKSMADLARFRTDIDFEEAHENLLIARRASLDVLSTALEQ